MFSKLALDAVLEGTAVGNGEFEDSDIVAPRRVMEDKEKVQASEASVLCTVEWRLGKSTSSWCNYPAAISCRQEASKELHAPCKGQSVR